jgi:hypothetical protein
MLQVSGQEEWLYASTDRSIVRCRVAQNNSCRNVSISRMASVKTMSSDVTQGGEYQSQALCSLCSLPLGFAFAVRLTAPKQSRPESDLPSPFHQWPHCMQATPKVSVGCTDPG